MFNEKEEKRNRWIVAFGCILVFVAMFASQCKGQGGLVRINRYDLLEKRHITTISPPSPMKIGLTEDCTKIIINSDSIGRDQYTVYLSVYYPKSFELTIPFESIIIDFDNGKTSYFFPVRKYKDNHIEYLVTSEQLGLLGGCNVSHVVLQNVQAYCEDERNKDYFIRFLKFLFQK